MSIYLAFLLSVDVTMTEPLILGVFVMSQAACKKTRRLFIMSQAACKEMCGFHGEFTPV